MTEEQAKELMDGLSYISGQLQGLAVISIATSGNKDYAVSGNEALQRLIQVAGSTPSSVPAWKKGFEAITAPLLKG